MDRNLLQKAAIQSLALMLGVIILSFAIKEYNNVSISASNLEDSAPEFDSIEEAEVHEIQPVIVEEDDEPIEELISSESPKFMFTSATRDISNDIVKQLGERYLVIRKPQGDGLQIQLEDQYITKNLKLIITGALEEVIDSNYIGRVNDEAIFIGEPTYIENETIVGEEDGSYTYNITRDYGNDIINDIIFSSPTEETENSIQEITLQLDHVYVHILYEDDYYYYIDLKRPKEVYERILVIDAGHGGKNPGALSRDEKIYEKNINLKMLLELKKLLDDTNIKVYYTRLLDDRLLLKPRVDLANDVDCDFFISIHNNSHGTSTKTKGTEILYYNHVHKGIAMKNLAKIFSDEISKTTSLKNRGTIQLKNDDVYILHHATVPAIMVEAGYLSNLDDLEYIKSEEGQAAIAEGIYNSIMRAYKEYMSFEKVEE